jgi:sulfite reductase beta subunit-like hemoprotein
MKNSRKVLLMLVAIVFAIGMTGCKAGCGCPQW